VVALCKTLVSMPIKVKMYEFIDLIWAVTCQGLLLYLKCYLVVWIKDMGT